MNFSEITRRIRRCKSEVTAQLVLEFEIAKAVAAEREACARIGEDWDCDRMPIIEEYVDAIRARSRLS